MHAEQLVSHRMADLTAHANLLKFGTVLTNDIWVSCGNEVLEVTQDLPVCYMILELSL